MFEFILGTGVGLIVGWNVLPQPLIIRTFYKRWFGIGE